MDSKTIILMYHSVDNSGSVISVSSELFRLQMRFFKESAFNVISLDDAILCMNGEQEHKKNSLVITFDDGFKNLFTEVFPILQEYGFTATIFLVPDYCGKLNNWPGQPESIIPQDLLSWREIEEMNRYGIRFEAHTLTHPFLTQVTTKCAEEEILHSKKIIEDRLQKDVEFFAYPYGDFNTEVAKIVSQYFKGACSTRLGVVSGKSDPFKLERVDAFYIKQSLFFKRLFSPEVTYYLKLRQIIRDFRQ